LVAFKRQKPPKWDQKGTESGLEGAQAYNRENPPKRDFSKSDSEQFLFRKFYMGRGGSKEPPGGIIYFWTVLFPNGALRTRPVKVLAGKERKGRRVIDGHRIKNERRTEG
jgi:hypothetical protein